MNAAQKLEAKIRGSIPLSEAMQFHIATLELEAIEVSAPLPPNVNYHGTGFAGSIYSLAVLTGWALCMHILDQVQVDADLVLARAEIRYRSPVTGDLHCRTGLDSALRESFLRDIENSGKGLLPLVVEIGGGPDAVLEAKYWAIARG